MSRRQQQRRYSRRRAAQLKGRRGRIAAGTGLAIGAALAVPATGQAAPFEVTNLNDSGSGSLRDAVSQANATSEADTITFQSSLSGSIDLTNGEIDITNPLTIVGPGADALTLHQASSPAARIFDVHPATDGAHVEIDGLTLTGGGDPTIDGGAIRNVNGNLTIKGSTLSGNHGNRGGAIRTEETHQRDPFQPYTDVGIRLHVENSTISDNTAELDGGGIDSFGNGVFPPVVSLQNSTISGNTAGAHGGGIYFRQQYRTVLSFPGLYTPLVNTYDSTISGNTADTGGGVATNEYLPYCVYYCDTRQGPGPTFDNSIIADNSATTYGNDLAVLSDCIAEDMQNQNVCMAPYPTSPTRVQLPAQTHFSLIEDSPPDSHYSDSTSIFGVDPQLGPLASNGGPTDTRAPAATSPVIDHGDSSAGTDQRGLPRPVDLEPIPNGSGDASDMGAVELQTFNEPSPGGGAGTGGGGGAGTAGGGGATGGGSGTPDTTAPIFASASLTNTVFAVNRRGPSETPVAARRARRGTTFKYTLSEPARVVFKIQRTLPGRRVRGRCRKPTRSNRTKPRCTRYRLFGRFAQQATAANNSKRWSGKIGAKTVAPGRYRATLSATDLAGNRSPPKRLRFKVVRR